MVSLSEIASSSSSYTERACRIMYLSRVVSDDFEPLIDYINTIWVICVYRGNVFLKQIHGGNLDCIGHYICINLMYIDVFIK